MEIKRSQRIGRWYLRLAVSMVAFLSASAFAADAPVDRMEASTVRVLVIKNDRVAGTGSGFIVGDGSYVVTNHHVAEGADGIIVAAKGLKVPAVRVVADDQQHDLTILELKQNSGRPAVEFSLRANVHKTQTILAAGFPGAADDEGSVDDLLEVKFTKGIISAFVKNQAGTLLYQIDAPINPGNSGGPLFDECGRVVGINELKSLREAVVVGDDGQPTKERLPYGEGVAWAIQADVLLPVLQSAGITPSVAPNACGAPGTSSAAPPGTPGQDGSAPGRGGPPVPQASNHLVIWGAGALLVLALAVGFVARTRPRPVAAGAGRFAPGTEPYRRDLPPAVRDLRLRGVSGAYAGKEFPVAGEPITLGRDPHFSQIVFDAQDSVVSKRHCIVRVDRVSGGMLVEDCGSTNGTFLENGERLRAGEPRLVRPYGSFYLGDRRHSFQVKG